MSLNELLQPDLILENSVLSLTPDILSIPATELVLDVDETLVPIKSNLSVGGTAVGGANKTGGSCG